MKNKIIVLLLVVLLIFTASCTKTNEEPNQGMETDQSAIFETSDVQNIKILTNDLNCRSGAGKEFSVVDKVDQNQILDVIGKQGDWYVVRLPNNKVGCVSQENAKPVVQDSEENTQIDPVQRLSDEENRMITLVNQERERNNLNPLQIDKEVARVADIKSQDMVENNYFSHNSPTYGSPFDMLKNFGIKFLHAGENIAGNSSIDEAHKGLMNSKGHRENILNPNFTHIGIGIKDSDRYGNIITQMFISKPK